MDSPAFDLAFEPAYGQAVPVVSGVERVTVNNPGPFTFFGTNSYIVGASSVAVIDPGPEDEAHFQALMAALGGRAVTHIVVSHTHRDHSPLARRLQAATGAVTVGQGPHRPTRPLRDGEINPFSESSDLSFVPDITLSDGQTLSGDGWALSAVLTPGHTANHAAFALAGRDVLFSGDHVMAWSTSIVAPPDGSMADYMESLDRLIERDDRLLLPGHGGPVTEPSTFLRALKAHRLRREQAVLARVQAGDERIAEMVKVIYRDTDPKLHGAAAHPPQSRRARGDPRYGRARKGPPSLAAHYR
ncbi:MBL fold metallo-hydrolase, partial [Rhizobium leguminosarum]|uniref:MBL fold metallo-hydrolase n=1 Tax=Rhizobium leguminosarum TaxID=384 RepID=UPI001FDF50CC